MEDLAEDLADEFGTQLVPETQLGVGQELPLPEDSSDNSWESISTYSSTKSTDINVEPRPSGRVTRPKRDSASQMSQEAAAAKTKAARKAGKGKGKGKARAEAEGSRTGKRQRETPKT
jgi:hypothetical protein